jgi:Spy/CpxP family protein refolding chaperone
LDTRAASHGQSRTFKHAGGVETGHAREAYPNQMPIFGTERVKKMRNRIVAIGVVVVALGALASGAWAYAGHRHGGMHRGGAFMATLRAANLTADQKTKIHDAFKANWSQKEALVKQLRSIHEQIDAKLLGPGAVAASDIAPLQQQAEKVRQQIAQQNLDTVLKIRGMLTPDQLKRMNDVHQKVASLWEQMKALWQPSAAPSPAATQGGVTE